MNKKQIALGFFLGVFLFVSSLNSEVYAIGGTITDQTSCENLGLTWINTNTCHVTGTLTVGLGETLIVDSSVLLSAPTPGLIDNFGTILNHGTINTALPSLNPGIGASSFYDHSYINNNPSGIINNLGTFNSIINNLGIIHNSDSMNIIGHSSIVSNNLSFIDNTGFFHIQGSSNFNNLGTIENSFGGDFGLSITTTFNNLGTINNYGILNTFGIINNNPSGLINNYEILLNFHTINNYGAIDNFGTLDNFGMLGEITNNCTGILKSSGVVSGNPVHDVLCIPTLATPTSGSILNLSKPYLTWKNDLELRLVEYTPYLEISTGSQSQLVNINLKSSEPINDLSDGTYNWFVTVDLDPNYNPDYVFTTTPVTSSQSTFDILTSSTSNVAQILSAGSMIGSITFTNTHTGPDSINPIPVAIAQNTGTNFPANVSFPYGLFSWTWRVPNVGDELELYIEFPGIAPTTYWKLNNGVWTNIYGLVNSNGNSVISSDPNNPNALILKIVDNGIYDQNNIPGIISDPSGPGILVSDTVIPFELEQFEGNYTMTPKTLSEIEMGYLESEFLLKFPQMTTTTEPLSGNMTTTTEPLSDPIIIPTWIKNNAGWWAEDSIDDDSFVQGLQFLIKEDILKIPPTEQGSSDSNEIAPWIKNNAGWWADGSIDDDSFVQGIQFLIEKGILKIN